MKRETSEMTEHIPVPKPLIDRLAAALQRSRDSIIEYAQGTPQEYGSVGEALSLDKILDEYREWRKNNPTKS